MILGLDVGGTQTDVVLIDEGEVVFTAKTPTESDLLETLGNALEKAVPVMPSDPLGRMAFSTTMATNAIVQERLPRAGMIVSAGPGMNPALFSIGPSYEIIQGCLDHRGTEIVPLDRKAVDEAVGRIQDRGIRNTGIVGKFSVRNPSHELRIAEWITARFNYLALGHQVSGLLNFPRRITTTYLNASLSDLHHRFISSLSVILGKRGLDAPRHLLKPDGGTVRLDHTTRNPVQTAQSGPAASVMGALALDGCPDTALVLDIGGTTTDISVILKGVPLLEPFGIRLGPYQTLVRSLLTQSVGIGGDSAVRLSQGGNLTIGPLREGLPMALGGPLPTPTDALVTLGLLDRGNREAARGAMEKLGSPRGWDARQTAARIMECMGRTIAEAARAFVDRLNARPVYTIHEVLHEERIEPDAVVLIGGPAACIAEFVGAAIGLPFRVPPHFDVANAVGAAVARVTTEVTLLADTERRTAVIPEADIRKEIFGRFNVDDARSFAEKVLLSQAVDVGASPGTFEISLLENQCFNMIRGTSKTGQNIRLKLGITPGLIPEWKERHPE